jgi:histidinol phosphatase-like enzyme (inositol monophosphatase family)
MPSLNELLAVATEAAYLGGRRTLAYFNAGVAVQTKADSTPVTLADQEAEQVIRARIARSFPSHAIIGEEGGETAGDAAYRWIIDPIDGTKTFIHGVPFYGVLIGVEVEGRPAVGAVYLPAFDEMVAAADGLGCRWNGREARVSAVADLAEATLLTTSVTSCMRRSDAYERLVAGTRLQRTWGDCYGYVLVATGRAEIMLDPAMNPWDCAPLLPILREAGGHFTTWDGAATIWGPDAVGTNAALHEQVLDVLRSEQRRS